MPLYVRSGSGLATSDYSRWWFAQTIGPYRAGTRSTSTPPRDRRQGGPWRHETFAKSDLSVVYVPGKDNTVADCLSRWAYPAGKAWMDISSHGDNEETEEAKRIIKMEKAMEQEGVKSLW